MLTSPKYATIPRQKPHEATPLFIPEVGSYDTKYQFDASVCGCIETDDTIIRDDVVYVSRSSSTCCGSSLENSLVKSREVLSADITTGNPCNSIFVAWILLGCLGHHRFCAGRRTSGIIMFLCFLISIVFTTVGFLLSPGYDCDSSVPNTFCNLNVWQAVGIVASVLLAVTVLWWFYDLFLIRHWSQYVSFEFDSSCRCSLTDSLHLTIYLLAHAFISKLAMVVLPPSAFHRIKLKLFALILKPSIVFIKAFNSSF